MSKILTQREEKILQILWKMKRAFVKQILAEMPPPKPPYNTVSSVVRDLAKKGLVGYQEYGNTYQYFPILKQSMYRKQMFKKLLQDYFSGSPESLLSHFVQEENVPIEKLEALLKKLKKENKK